LKEYLSRSAVETMAIGEALGKQLAPNSVVCFFGDLAAGKTTFIKGFAAGAADCDPNSVQSPTFNYLSIYLGPTSIYHFDLYRLRDSDEFLSMGFDELFEADGICCIEWSERIIPLLPERCIRVHMSHEGDDLRRIVVTGLEAN
jgi:tRNA threonylcarbamoyladenosine biosynthesis protein TsaE